MGTDLPLRQTRSAFARMPMLKQSTRARWRFDKNWRALTTEGIRELPDDLVRHSRFVLAVALRQAILGHQEGAEQDIPDRESAREIAVAALFQRGVMPTVEDRTRQHIFERPEGPAQVGVHEG